MNSIHKLTTILLFLFLFSFNTVEAQIKGTAKTVQSEALSDLFHHYEVYSINVAEIEESLRRSNKQFTLELGTILNEEITLEKNEIRSADFKIITSNGFEDSPLPCITYKGINKKGEDNSTRLTISDQYISGVIKTKDGSVYIQALQDIDKTSTKGQFVVYHASDIKESNAGCESTSEALPPSMYRMLTEAQEGEGLETQSIRCAQLAVGTDYLLFNDFGSTSAMQMHIESVFNLVQDFYLNESGLDLDIEIAQLQLADGNSPSDDPWNNSLSGSQLLTHFGNASDNVFSGAYDLTTLYTSQSVNGLGGMASTSYACLKKSPSVIWKHSGNSLMSNIWIHELGHLLGASHNSEGSNCNAMSPITINCTPYFAQTTFNEITSLLNSSTCLNCGDENMPNLYLDFYGVSSFYQHLGAFLGETYTITSKIKNTGSTNIGASVLGYYLSEDDITNFDVNNSTSFFMASTAVDPILSGGFKYINYSLTFPPNTPTGVPLYLYPYADGGQIITEFNEQDNYVNRYRFVVRGNGADLTPWVTTLFNGTDEINAGEIFEHSLKVYNYGNEYAASSQYKVYLSSDQLIDNGDDLMGQGTIGALAAQTTYGQSSNDFSYQIPSNKPTGTYYIIYQVDANNQVSESVETNNIEIQELHITGTSLPCPANVVIQNGGMTIHSAGLTIALQAHADNLSSDFYPRWIITQGTQLVETIHQTGFEQMLYNLPSAGTYSIGLTFVNTNNDACTTTIQSKSHNVSLSNTCPGPVIKECNFESGKLTLEVDETALYILRISRGGDCCDQYDVGEFEIVSNHFFSNTTTLEIPIPAGEDGCYTWWLSKMCADFRIVSEFETGCFGCEGKLILDEGKGKGKKLAISESLELDMNVFPNPTSDQLSVEFSQASSEDGELRLYSLNGQELQSVNVRESTIQKLNLSAYPVGVYLLQYRSASQVISKKIIIER